MPHRLYLSAKNCCLETMKHSSKQYVQSGEFKCHDPNKHISFAPTTGPSSEVPVLRLFGIASTRNYAIRVWNSAVEMAY